MAAEYDKSVFDIADLYDIKLKEYEAYCKEYAEYERDEECEYFDDDDYSDDRETPQQFRERLLNGTVRGKDFVLVKYNGCAETVTVPDIVTSIGSYAFANNTTLREVYIPDTVTSMGSHVFTECEVLQSVRLSENLNAIEEEAFSGCSSLEQVTVPDSVQALCIHAFDDCKSLRDVRLGKNLRLIGWNAFARCKSLKTVRLPERLEQISLNVFYGSGLEEIYIPKNVSSLSSSAFLHCEKLKRIEVDPENSYYYSRDNCVYLAKNRWLVVGRNDGTLPDDGSFTVISGEAFADNHFVTELKIPNGVTRIDTAAFRGCVNLRRVSFPDTLEVIGRCAFEGCTALEEVVIPGGVKKIEGLTFFRSGIKKVVIKRGVETIDNAFDQCPNLRELYIPSSVTDVWCDFDSDDDGEASHVRVYLEKGDGKYYEDFIEEFEGLDVVLDFESDIFD